MKSNKGISLITLIVTIIVLVIISSITIYNGGNMIEQARIRNATDRMMTVANAIASFEEELGFSDVVVGSITGEYKLLGVDEYEIMGLEDFKNDTQMPPIYVFKSGDSTTSNKKEYKLKTPKIIRKDGAYAENDFVHYSHSFYDDNNRENYKIEFDTVKGVNRPLLTEDMMAVKTRFDADGWVYSEPVKDIYDEDWYDYSNTSPNWANVKMNDNIYYVWIPRFAYKVESFYIGTSLSNIPASAIKVAFLKGTSDYMANDDVLPTGYQVHPAFKYYDNSDKEVNIPGFWVAKYNVNNLVDVLYKDDSDPVILGALEEIELTSLHGNSKSIVDNLESRLLKNTEWAAVAYLSFATVGKTDDGSSLINNPSAVMDLNVRQYVAGCLKDTVPAEKANYFDEYEIISGDMVIYKPTEDKEDKRHGDAIIATSSGTSEQSSWFGGRSVKISTANPYIIRGVDNCIFSYDAESENSARGAGCRNVLLVKTVTES